MVHRQTNSTPPYMYVHIHIQVYIYIYIYIYIGILRENKKETKFHR